MRNFTLLCFLLLSAGCMSTKPYQTDTVQSLPIGGVEQSLAFVGDSNNPIMLILHGGGLPLPGIASKHQFPLLAEHFLLVFWDQRGVGASANKQLLDSDMRMANYLADVQEITAYLKSTYHKDKLFLLGHSWGAQLGLLTVASAPQDYTAYIGISQPINVSESDALVFAELTERAREKGKDGNSSLAALGTPPYEDVADWLGLREQSARNGGLVSGEGDMGLFGFLLKLTASFLFNSDVGYSKIFSFQSDMNLALAYAYDDMAGFDVSAITELSIPVAFIHGEHDMNAHPALIKEWVERLEAPSKKLLMYERSAHMPMWEEPGRFEQDVLGLLMGID